MFLFSVFLNLKDFCRCLTDFSQLYLLHWAFPKLQSRAKTEQLSAEARKANTILAQVGMHVRQRDKLLSETFVDMDLNQHGSLSYQELRGGLDRIGVHLNNDDYSLLLSKVDADNNGRVEFQEFAQAVKADVRDTAAPTPMTGPVLGTDGQPIRVGESCRFFVFLFFMPYV